MSIIPTLIINILRYLSLLIKVPMYN